MPHRLLDQHLPSFYAPSKANLLRESHKRPLRRSPVVGIDLDGVVYDFVKALRLWSVEQYGFRHEDLPDGTCWDFWDKQWHWTAQEFSTRFAAGVNAGVIYRHGDAIPGAIEGLNALHDAGFVLHIVTNRAQPGTVFETVEASTRAWLHEQGAPFHKLSITADKHLVPLDLALEDYDVNYRLLRKAGVNAWLFHRPWNVNSPALFRAHSWSEFVNHCTTHATP